MSEHMPEPVWSNAPFWKAHEALRAGHDVRQSEIEPAMIAYFPSADKRERNLRTRVKPGRYLQQHFGNILTPAQIKFYATWQATQIKPDDQIAARKATVVQFATTPDEIEQVYVTGPTSCMSHRSSDYSSSCHPTRVYGAGDLAIAYLDGDDGKPIARALCWPSKSVFGRVYPTPDIWSQDGYASHEESLAVQNSLIEALAALGYESLSCKHNGFNGARLIRKEEDGKLVMPYLDNSYMFNDDGDEVVLSRSGDYSGDSTDGLVRARRDNYATCERCDDDISDESDAREVATSISSGGHGRDFAIWCEHCADNHTFYCNGVSETFSDDVGYGSMGGETYSDRWLENNATYSDHSNDWFEGEAVAVGDETWSADEFAEDGFTCAIDGENYPNNVAHPDYPAIHRDTYQDDIVAWLTDAGIADGSIVDARQLSLALAA